jgi:hypothetical protein
VPRKKEVKVGVQEGGGPEPGYLWTVLVLDVAFDEAHNILTDPQYEHMARQIKDLATERQPSHSQLCDVDQIEDFYELRDKGGILGPKNVRVFFGIDTRGETHNILVLGAILKQNNGPTPQGDKLRMRRRWRKYLAGEYSS